MHVPRSCLPLGCCASLFQAQLSCLCVCTEAVGRIYLWILFIGSRSVKMESVQRVKTMERRKREREKEAENDDLRFSRSGGSRASSSGLETAHLQVDFTHGRLENGRRLLLLDKNNFCKISSSISRRWNVSDLRCCAQIVAVDREDLVALHEASVGFGGAAFHHVRDVDAGTVAPANDAEPQTSAGLLEQLHLDYVEHVVILERSLIPVDHDAHLGRRLAQNGQSPAVGDVAEALAVHLQDLIAGFEPAVLVGRSIRVHLVDQDGALCF